MGVVSKNVMPSRCRHSIFRNASQKQRKKLEEKNTWMTCPANTPNKLDEEILTSHPW